jgi:hypothetical protein
MFKFFASFGAFLQIKNPKNMNLNEEIDNEKEKFTRTLKFEKVEKQTSFILNSRIKIVL